MLTLEACCVLAQNDPSMDRSFLGFSHMFWLTVAVIFVVAIIGALIRMRRRDKCLKLLHDYPVTCLSSRMPTMWGDLRVVSKGIEVCFDAPYHTRRGLTKHSSLLYEDEYKAFTAFCRTPYGLNEQEQRDRQQQIRRSYKPGPFRLAWRWCRNLLNTIRDAVVTTFSLFTGQIHRGRQFAGAIASQKGRIDELGGQLIALAGNAYEPLLERHIGKPVILELTNPTTPDPSTIELPGYLVDYSDAFLAVFNEQYEALRRFELVATENTEQDGVVIQQQTGHVRISYHGDDALVVHRLRDGDRIFDLAVVLLKGCSVRLACSAQRTVKLELELTRTIDIVCPRAVGRVRFSGAEDDRKPRERLGAAAPQLER